MNYGQLTAMAQLAELKLAKKEHHHASSIVL